MGQSRLETKRKIVHKKSEAGTSRGLLIEEKRREESVASRAPRAEHVLVHTALTALALGPEAGEAHLQRLHLENLAEVKFAFVRRTMAAHSACLAACEFHAVISAVYLQYIIIKGIVTHLINRNFN